ncbi:MAG: amino acid ABC transporter permease [Proteobacteria bacterium]|nr:amino acid ABC transporter permease [Pseudomonadota bacterium]MBU1595763.1 amino acid ABC transporter permease [Pseudomonadota bacterium]
MPDPLVRPAPLSLPVRRSGQRGWLRDWLLFLLLAFGLLWLLLRGAAGLGYNWQWYQVPRALFTHADGGLGPGPLVQGLLVTLRLTGLSFAGAFAVGLAAALLRLSGSLAGRVLARTYLELVRNTPLIIQLFFLYFVLSPLLDMEAIGTAVLGLSLFEGAYVSEILRAGVLSIDPGQWDAARSLGMGTGRSYLSVILPQAVRRVLPPLAGQGVSLIKDSSLASVIAINELTLRGQNIVSETFLSFEIWFTVAAIYWIVTTALSGAADALERRLAYPA